MKFLPIVRRELRVAARRRNTYWLRSGIALAVVLLSAWIFLVSIRDSPRALGRTLFNVLTGGALAYCLLAGLRSTADCLSEEKREGTLGLLFLTDLKGHDVVLGKLAVNSLNAFYGLLAVMPVLAIPLLVGGVTGGELARVALVLLNTLFFSMAAGLFVSALCRSHRKAMGATFLLLLLFTAGFPACGAWLAYRANWGTVETTFLLPSAVYSYALAQDRAFGSVAERYYWSVSTIQVLGWMFLALASLIAPRAWQDRPVGARAARWQDSWRRFSRGSVAERGTFRTRLLNRNAFFWLAARARLKPAWVWLTLGLLACGWVWGLAKFEKDWLNIGTYLATAFLLNSLLKCWLASEAGRQLSEDRKAGSLELLLSTPLTVREILRGQRMALSRQFLAPAFLVFGLEIAMMVATLNDPMSRSEMWLWFCLWQAGMIALVADLIALYWVGMWLGLAARNPKRAYTETVVRVLVLPWAGFAAFIAGVVVLNMASRSEPGWGVFLGTWLGLTLAADVGFGLWARHKLLTEFRTVATQRFQPRVALWRRIFGRTGAAGGEAGLSLAD